MIGKVLKFLGIAIGSFILLVVIFISVIYFKAEARFNKTYSYKPESIEVNSDSASIAEGAHMFVTRGCAECHGADLSGKVVIDNPAMGTFIGMNITRGKGGLPQDFSNVDFVRAIRHSISKNNLPLKLMPSEDYFYMSDSDLGDLIAYINSVPPVDKVNPPSKAGFISRMLLVAGKMPLLSAEKIDHTATRPEMPPVAATVDYGEYLSKLCMGCHRPDFSGGPVPGGDPSWPPAANLTPNPTAGIGNWTEEDFIHALKEGKRPDGTAIDPSMPFAQFGQMKDVELQALWVYLRSLPEKDTGS